MARLIVQAHAQGDIDAALAWYNHHDLRLPARLMAELDVTFSDMCESPGRFPVVEGPYGARFYASSPTASISLPRTDPSSD
jgi:hypothetical protein